MRRSTLTAAAIAILAIVAFIVAMLVQRPATGPGPGPASPTPVAASPTPPATASPAVSPTASPRALRPFTGVVPISLLGPTTLAPDRGRIAYLTAAGELAVLDAGSEQPRVMRRPQDGFLIELDPHGLRGDTLVFLETRTDGQRTDARAMRVDLATNTVTTLDDYSGPYLGGGDTWRPRAPVTNGRDIAWIRVDDERPPFGVHVVLSRSGATGTILSSGSSAAWIDLDDQGRVLISTLIGEGEVAELVLWQDGASTPLGTRPSGEGGPAVFVGEKAFWQRGTGIVARSEGGELIEVGREVRPVEFVACGAAGAVGRYLLLYCYPGIEVALLDPVSAERFELPGINHVAGARAVAWREGSQWWLGTIAP